MAILAGEYTKRWQSAHALPLYLREVVITRQYHTVHVGETATWREDSVGLGHAWITDQAKRSLDDLALKNGEYRCHLVRVSRA